ncbi:MAG: YitT family protein [Candidatus Faecivicinus sp.]|nr:YitT family protein [Candidatus Faecivicinus sp.]
MNRKLHPEVKNAFLIIAGLLCSSAAYNLYLIPNNIAAGGFTGIGQLVNHFADISVGTVSILLNVPLFLLSLKSLGLRFGLRSLIAMFGLSLLIDHLPLPTATNDMLLACIFGGVLSGLGFGLVLRGSATTGGTDMLASLIHRHIPFIRVSVGIFAVDGLVIFASAFVFDQQAAMYALICTFLMNVVVDLVLEGPNSATSYFVISAHSDEIAQRVMEQMDRGVTAFYAKGMYSGEDKQVLLCVVNRFESVLLRKIVFAIDPKAFVIANKAHEVLGEGFKTHD